MVRSIKISICLLFLFVVIFFSIFKLAEIINQTADKNLSFSINLFQESKEYKDLDALIKSKNILNYQALDHKIPDLQENEIFNKLSNEKQDIIIKNQLLNKKNDLINESIKDIISKKNPYTIFSKFGTYFWGFVIWIASIVLKEIIVAHVQKKIIPKLSE